MIIWNKRMVLVVRVQRAAACALSGTRPFHDTRATSESRSRPPIQITGPSTPEPDPYAVILIRPALSPPSKVEWSLPRLAGGGIAPKAK
jgi:hypothetical protein